VLGARQRARCRLVAQQQRRDLLQHVTDPAGAEALPAFEARDRQRVARRRCDAEIGAEHL
jgi:hypothetical protein